MKRYQVMLAKHGDKEILDRKSPAGFIFEPKFDGTRILIYKEGNDIELINRRDHDVTFRYPELLEIPRNIKADSCVLDAELVILNKEGKPDFNMLQQREQLDNKIAIDLKSREMPATLFVFDILEKDGESLVDKFLGERKRILGEIIKNGSFISTCPFTTDGKELWSQIQEQKMEGIMAKELNSKYEQGKRSWSWLKIKNLNTVDAIIVGFTKGEGEREKYFGALILAVYVPDKDELVYIGKVGTGFDKKSIKMLTKKMKKIITKKSFLNKGQQSKVYYGRNVHELKITWVKPELIAEIKYLELTKDKELRAPSFMRLRFDKNPEDCILLS